ncbi:hypothetical protein BJX76DRAFT_356400 [Aspergillus varians]
MTRIPRRSASVFARRSSSWVVKRKARKHKVILESVTQEKKKLRSVISFEAKAPPGYTFISAGDPHFTTTCKEICRRDGLKVYAVSTTPHLHTHGLSQHVHRIGYHFPSAVVADVCMDRGLYLSATGKAVSFYNMSNETSHRHTDSDSQITINTEARDVLKDLFPNIPNNDLNQIIKTAFQKVGQRKVGTAVELPLARRAQLAVVAHIRHIYTNYDRLLKTTSFHEARAAVEQPTLARLVEWRGDDENGKPVLEDVFREVIVISDDDDSDIEGEPLPLHGRDTSVEVISSNPVIEELQMRPVNHGNPAPREPQVENTEDEAAPGFRFIPEAPKQTKIDRRGFSRYQAWDRALNRYRNMTNGSSRQIPSYSVGEPLQETPGLSREPPSRRPIDLRHSSVVPYALPNQRAVKSNLSRPLFNTLAEHPVSSAPLLCVRHFETEPRPGNPAVLTLDEPYELYPVAELPNKRKDVIAPFNPPNPVPLERAPISESARHSLQQSDQSNGPVFVSGPREIYERNGDGPRTLPQPPGHLHNRNVNQQDRVLPSIESPLPMEIQRPNSGHIEHLTKRMSGAFTFRSVTPHRQVHQVHQVHQDFPNHILPQESIQAHVSKKRRVAYHEPIPMEKPIPPRGPTTLSTYPGNRYATGGQASVQNGPHVRRRYVAPVEPLRIGEHESGSVQDSYISTARFDRESQIPAYHGPIKAYDGQPFSHSRLVDSQATHHRSPGQSHIVSDTRYSVAAAGARDRIVHPHPSDPTEPRISQNTQENNSSDVWVPETTGPRVESTWCSKNSVPYKPAEKQKLYADGFVRPVDIREPGILEYRPTHRLPSNHTMESPPQTANSKFRGVQHRRVPSDSLASLPPRGRTHLDFLAKDPSQQYPGISDQRSRHHDGGLFGTPPPVYQDGKHPKGTLTPSRYGHKEDPIPIGT